MKERGELLFVVNVANQQTLTGEKLDLLLGIYGAMKQKSFYERVRKYKQALTPKDELRELLERGSDEQLRTLLTVAKGIIGRTTETRRPHGKEALVEHGYLRQ